MVVEHKSQQTEPGRSIQDLSSELLYMIMDYLPFSTQFNLACTCKRLALASRGILEHHQNSHGKYRAASDLDPSTVPLLLRSAFGQLDPISAWHVRSFEVWRDRTAWSEWHVFDLYTPLAVGPDSIDSKPSQLRVSKEDARRYLYWFEEQVGEDLDSEVAEELLARVESGHDGLLKALLFAKLERLEDLKFVTRSQEAGSCLKSLQLLIAECIKKEAAEDGGDTEDSHDWGRSDGKGSDSEDFDQRHESNAYCKLRDDEQRSADAGVPWPTGLRQIQQVAVGVTSATWMDDDRDEEPCLPLFSHLLRLPSLNSIYFKRLCAWDSDTDPEEEECEYEVLPKGSSSVKHIFLHGSSGQFGEDEDDIWAGPRNLLTVSFRFDGPEEFDGATGTVNSLARVQGESLQSLMWYGYRGGYGSRNIIGDHCSILDNEEFDRFKRLPVVRQVSCSTHDIDLCIMHADTYQCLRFDPEEGRADEDEQGNIYDESNHEEFIVRRVATMFPRSMETLVLWDSPDDEGLIERGIIKMIQGGQYKDLKAIFLEATQKPRSEEDELLYLNAVAAGIAAGVDVHTLANRQVMRHSVEFVEAPDEYDLKSGIHLGVRPSDWVFDPYLGRRTPPGSTSSQHNALWARHDSMLKDYRHS